MLKNKNPIIVVNWKDNVSTMAEIKNLLKEINKEYLILNKNKYKALKKKLVKKEMHFYLSIPSPFIYGIQEFLKKTPAFKKVIIGAQNFDSVSKQNQNNNITLSQIKNINSKFIILNSNIYSPNNSEPKNDKVLEINKNKETKITHNLILDRLNAVSKKFKDENSESQNINKDFSLIEKVDNLKNKNFKEIETLSEKLNSSLAYKIPVVIVLNRLSNDLELLTNLVKNLIKNIHYNLFNNLMICYQDFTNESNNLRVLNLENCQEKAIAIRRTVANLFGIDNAKKIKIIYEGEVDSTNVIDLLEQGGVDGILLNEESLKPKFLAKILSQIS